jgi:hypothetical protein
MLGALPDKPRERQANEFAAELLMPRRAVAEDVRARDLSFEFVKRLASSFRYDVSITSCALRVVEVTREKCALICYENCRLKWAIRSKGFDYALPPKGTPPKLESLTLAVAQGEMVSDAIARVSATAWVDPRSTTEEVVESVFAIPSQKQVLALVTVYEES